MTNEAHINSLLKALSDDLRSSIGATSTLANMLLETYGSQLDERGHKWLSMMTSENGYVSSKLNALSAYALLFDYRPVYTPCSLEEVVQSCLSEAGLINKLVCINLETKDLPNISTDKLLIKKYLNELLLNSFLHAKPQTSEDTGITIECYFRYSNHENGYTLVYQDNGQDLSQSDIEYIQQPFNTLKSSRNCTNTAGIGLSHLQRIAELLDATIIFEIGNAPYTGLKTTLSCTKLQTQMKVKQ